MCVRCVQIDEAIAAYQELSRWVADRPTVREMEKLIQKYRLDRRMLHPPTNELNLPANANKPRDYTGKSKQIDLELQAEAEKALWTARTMAPELKSGGFEEGWPLTQGC
jgi:hypothetical protein